MPLTVTTHSPSSKASRDPSQEDLARIGMGDRMAIAAAMAEAARRGLMPDGTRLAALVGPKTDTELLDAVQELTGHRIPRTSVCLEHGHTSPAQTFCDLYFNRLTNCLWIGNRGGGKTANSGQLHGAKNRWNEGYESAIAGAVAKQGYRAYAEFKRFTKHLGDEIVSSIMSKTEWANMSMTEVLGGTVAQLNGPHPHFAQLDEAELTTEEPYQEFLNMAQGDEHYPAQQLLTSTRKKAYGLVQRIVKESQDAVKLGVEPPWEVRIFCVFETMKTQPNCRTAPENAGRPEEELCQCHKVVKGEWGEDAPRPELRHKIRHFADVCNGRAYRADGFVSIVDVHSRFRQLSRMVWEAQQECLRPSIEGIVHKWVKDKVYLSSWEPHMRFGRIYRGWDWGGQNPHAIVWCQKIDVDVGLTMNTETGDLEPILSDDDERPVLRLLKTGSLIQFDEIYGAAETLGEFSTLGLRAVLREEQWRKYGYAMVIERDFCDPAGYIAKKEVKKAIRDFRTALERGHLTDEQLMLLAEFHLDPDDHESWTFEVPEFKTVPAPRYESIRKHIEWGEDGKIYLVEAMCPATSDEYDVYHWEEQKPGKNAPEDAAKEDDHAMDAKRYLIWNLNILENKASGKEAPTSAERVKAPSGEQRESGQFAHPQVAPSEAPVLSSEGGLPDYLTGPPGGATSVRRVAGPSIRR